MLAGQQDVGHLGAGMMEHVDVNPEVQLREALPGEVRVRHVHEGAGLVDAALQGVGVAVDGSIPNMSGIGPLVVIGEQRESVGTHHVVEYIDAVRQIRRIRLDALHRNDAQTDKLRLDLLGHIRARNARRLLVEW